MQRLLSPRLFSSTASKSLILAPLMTLAMASASPSASAQTRLPTDARPTCTVSPTEFSGWFAPGPISKDSVARPANSLAFAPDSLCSFYKWSSQMFLWMTSPSGNNSRVFSSSTFFGLEAVGADSMRKLVPQTDEKLLNFAPDIVLLGKAGQEVVEFARVLVAT